MDVLGRHVLIDYYDVSVDVLDDLPHLREALVDAADIMGAEIEVVEFNQFEPYGVSGTVVISESHLTLHTWPEYRFAAIDVFVCSDALDLEAAKRLLEERFEPGEIETRRLGRGRPHLGQSRSRPEGFERASTSEETADAPDASEAT
jgi:S-adenosylmethionine decarboxylase proenzyme